MFQAERNPVGSNFRIETSFDFKQAPSDATNPSLVEEMSDGFLREARGVTIRSDGPQPDSMRLGSSIGGRGQYSNQSAVQAGWIQASSFVERRFSGAPQCHTLSISFAWAEPISDRARIEQR